MGGFIRFYTKHSLSLYMVNLVCFAHNSNSKLVIYTMNLVCFAHSSRCELVIPFFFVLR